MRGSTMLAGGSSAFLVLLLASLPFHPLKMGCGHSWFCREGLPGFWAPLVGGLTGVGCLTPLLSSLRGEDPQTPWEGVLFPPPP